MVIDTSALMAILLDEPERRSFNKSIAEASACVMSTATFVEASMVIESRFGAEGIRDLDLFIERAGIELAPDPRQPDLELLVEVVHPRLVVAGERQVVHVRIADEDIVPETGHVNHRSAPETHRDVKVILPALSGTVYLFLWNLVTLTPGTSLCLEERGRG